MNNNVRPHYARRQPLLDFGFALDYIFKEAHADIRAEPLDDSCGHFSVTVTEVFPDQVRERVPDILVLRPLQCKCHLTRIVGVWMQAVG